MNHYELMKAACEKHIGTHVSIKPLDDGSRYAYFIIEPCSVNQASAICAELGAGGHVKTNGAVLGMIGMFPSLATRS